LQPYSALGIWRNVEGLVLKPFDFGNIETRYGCNQPDVEQFDDIFWQVPLQTVVQG
jgi:hypothetical protein